MPNIDHYLDGVRVLEVADESGEYAGKVLAGLGADVVKVEPLEGESTRRIGPFRGDVPDPEGSLHFWHYNHGKRSIALDLDDLSERKTFLVLAKQADIILDTRPRGYLSDRGAGFKTLHAANPSLIFARISPFGDDGPWADYQTSDLIHLALGGVMMNCGYDPHPTKGYDTPPIAPQMWHAYHIAGEMTVIAILGALAHRRRTGQGQQLSTSVHQAVSQNTETDLPDWVYLRQPHFRQTCRHSFSTMSMPALSLTKDGRYVMPYKTYLRSAATYSSAAPLGAAAVLAKYGADEGLFAAGAEACGKAEEKLSLLIDRLSSRLKFTDDLWRDGQNNALPWAPVRRPEENVPDPHWAMRGAFTQVRHPDADRVYDYVGARLRCVDAPWKVSRGAPPKIGEHRAAILEDWSGPRTILSIVEGTGLDRKGAAEGLQSKPLPLAGVRVLDLGWMLASAGAGRYLSALGAEVIKVEHGGRIDGLRFGAGRCPPGGREERESATGPLPTPTSRDPNRCGAFSEVNSGKLGLSLNLKTEMGKKLLEQLIRNVDVIVEGFSPRTMERMGFGYDRLKEINPRIVYAQQSGFGEYGLYGRIRAFGPTAQALTGISEMSGLPEPFPPAGIGYSYLDWFGAYNLATAMLAGLHRQATTGEGCHIDASQAEIGIYLTGTAILDHSVNGRRWSRYGNRSPFKKAAPHGAYRTAGPDNWIAIAAFTDGQWQALCAALARPEWSTDPRFSTLEARLGNQDALDVLVEQTTASFERYALMTKLQGLGVPAGVCQTTQDRCDLDPQLAHEGWQVELPQSAIGTWPIKQFPVVLERTPAHVGGITGRAGPNYGEDTDRVLTSICGLTSDQIARLREAEVV